MPFEYLHIKVEDTLTANIASHFETIDAFLASAKAASGRAIVHCAFGQSRSVTALVSHLMLLEKRSLGEALECVLLEETGKRVRTSCSSPRSCGSS